MLDINLWSQFYWEHPDNQWKNLANEINNSDPYQAAIHVSQTIKKINNDYFQECAELSLGYYPTIQTEEKYKKLKKSLGKKVKSINVENWIGQLKKIGNKGNIFFYYFQKQLEIKNSKDIIFKLDNYDQTIVDYLKNEITVEDKNLENIHISLSNHLTSMIETEKDEKVNFVIDFFNQEKDKTWFKNNLNHILGYRTFLLYIANVIEYSEDNIEEVTDFLNNNAQSSKLIEFNSNILAYIETFTQEQRLSEFVNNLPLESYTAFKKIVFEDISTIQSLQKWYELVIAKEKTPKDFLEKIWQLPTEPKGTKILFTVEPDSVLLDFIAEKMTQSYTREQIESYDFTQSILHNNDIKDIMQKKVSYYYLSNKLSPHNKKTKTLKI